MYEIESNVPAPARRGGPGNPKFPLAQMKVGDSFHVPFGDRPLQIRSVVSNALAAYKLRNPGWEYRTAKDDTGVRVWRLA